MKTRSMAITFKASFKPSDAPVVAASIILTEVFGRSILTEPLVTEYSDSGIINLAQTKLAGADITDAANKCPALTPIFTYTAKTLPATVAIPPVIRAINSDLVIFPI